VLRSRRDQGGGRHRERRPRFASSSGPCAARPWSSRSSARARIRLTARPEYVLPPFSSGLLQLAASRFEIHAVRDPVRAAFLFVGSSLFVRQCRRMTQGSGGVPCPVCDGFDRREVRDRSRDLQPFHPGCGCVVLVIDDASTSPPAGRVARYVDSFFTRLRKSSTRAGALAAHHHLVVPKLCLLRAHSGAFRPADVVTHVLNGSHLRTGSAGLLDGSRAVIEGSGRLETLRYKCSAGNEIMHLNYASSITSHGESNPC